MKDCLETVIEEGVRLYCIVRADNVSDPRKARGFREKTQKQRAIDRAKLDVVAGILDRLGWAMTPNDAERKLKNLSGIPCYLGPCDDPDCGCNKEGVHG